MQLVWSLARATPAAFDWEDLINGGLQHSYVMHIGCRQGYRQWDPFPLDHKMALRARFAAIRWIRPGFFAPPGAATVAESIAARDQSIWSASPRRFNKTLCSFFHTPASCHSWSRRQQVIPLPQPISLGSISQGIPVLSTNRIPVNTALSGKRDLPPFGLGG